MNDDKVYDNSYWDAFYEERKIAKKKRRTKRKIKRIFNTMKWIAILIAIMLMATAIYFRDEIFTGKDLNDKKVIENLSEYIVSGADREKVKEILDHRERYPIELLDLINKNPETIDFVYHYPEYHDREVEIDLSEEIRGNQVPLYLQWDERWGYAKYGGKMIAESGCGPTCLSMVASYLLKDARMNPKWMAEFGEKNGYVNETGTLWTFMTQGVRKLGLESIQIDIDEKRVRKNLEVGNPIICSMGPGDFTSEGHFIVLAGIDHGKIIINDPNSKKNSEKTWIFSDIEDQIKNMWIIR